MSGGGEFLSLSVTMETNAIGGVKESRVKSTSWWRRRCATIGNRIGKEQRQCRWRCGVYSVLDPTTDAVRCPFGRASLFFSYIHKRVSVCMYIHTSITYTLLTIRTDFVYRVCTPMKESTDYPDTLYVHCNESSSVMF